MDIFLKNKDIMLDFIDQEDVYNLRHPLKRLGGIVNNYNPGEFIVVGGRRTSGKSSFILNNYVTSPLYQKIFAKRLGKPFDLKVIYINTKKSEKSIMERMALSFSSYKNKGNKVGAPSLYSFEGKHVKISRDKAKNIVSSSLSVFSGLVEKGFLSMSSGQKSLSEIDVHIRGLMEDYGDYDDDTNTFKYHPEHKGMTIIVAIDDISGISSSDGKSNFKNDNAHKVGAKLRDLTRIFNILIVLSVPSAKVYTPAGPHRSTVEEVAPYDVYADRCLIMHNPMETSEKSMNGYETTDFTHPKTGVCYLRTLYIATNHMGPSGIYLGLFMFPENGYMLELPDSENVLALEALQERITPPQKDVIPEAPDAEEVVTKEDKENESFINNL